MLPKVRNAVSIYQKETIPFLGLNRSDNTQEGEFSHQKNMSGRRYPFLAPRLPRQDELFGAPTALFSWDGREIMVDMGQLLLDGEVLCDVSDGAKQFAVVNTKLIVWPDAIAVDLSNKTAKMLQAEVINKGVSRFSPNSLTLETDAVYARKTLRISSSSSKKPWIWTYGSVSWEDGWVLGDGAWTTPDSADGRYYIPEVSYNEKTGTYSTDYPPCILSGDVPTDYFTPGNEIGFYAKITKTSYTATASSYNSEITVDIFWSEQSNIPLTEIFSVGDVVSTSGTLYGVMDVENCKISEIDTLTNTLLFDQDVFPKATAVYKATTTKDYQAFRYKDLDSEKHINLKVSGGCSLLKDQVAVYYATGKTLKIYSDFDALKKGEVLERFDVVSTESVSSTTWFEAKQVDVTDVSFSVVRRIPELSYICEHENRLWGVSNKDKTIYASALGDPNNFYNYTGDAGSWSVAVGSEGDFTGICSYGGGVLCWKERSLHKVLGDVPSNYQTGTYRFSGVRAGAHKSLVNVNETLFFLGVDGVYTYSGNKPALISKALGTDVLKEGVGGTDGRAYYLSAKNGETWELLNYDTHTGLWSRSDETQAVDFCRIGDYVKYLSADTFVYTIGAGEESVEWEAVFCPMYETLEGGKQYNKLIFRVSVPKDGYLYADVRFDDGRWIQTGGVKGKTGAVQMAVPLRRCDKFEVRLRGKGDCCVMEMLREFRLRGER